MRPEKIWKLSNTFYKRGWIRRAKFLKAINYFVFRAILPYEVQTGKGLNLWHRGLNLVVHPNVTIGDNVNIAHNVTIAGSMKGMTRIEDGVSIGAGAVFVPAAGDPYTIGAGAIIGAGSIVIGDVAPGSTMRGLKAQAL